MNKRYSLEVTDGTKSEKCVFKYYNQRLESYEFCKKVPLKTIVDLTTRFNSSEELIAYLKSNEINKLGEDTSIYSDVVITYESKGIRKLGVLYKDTAHFFKDLELDPKGTATIIRNTKSEEKLDELFNEFKKILNSNLIARKEIYDKIIDQNLKQSFIDCFNGEIGRNEVKELLKNYRNYYDIVLLCDRFRKKYNFFEPTNQEMAEGATLELLKFYLENPDKIPIDENETKESKTKERETKVKKTTPVEVAHNQPTDKSEKSFDEYYQGALFSPEEVARVKKKVKPNYKSW